MAYINEDVPAEERRTFKIPYSGREKTPWKWTIDREKDVILFKYMEAREKLHNEFFAFIYKGKVCRFMMNERTFPTPGTVRWKIASSYIPEELNEQEVLSELRKAFTAYGSRGMTPEYIEIWKRNLNVENPNGFAMIDF